MEAAREVLEAARKILQDASEVVEAGKQSLCLVAPKTGYGRGVTHQKITSSLASFWGGCHLRPSTPFYDDTRRSQYPATKIKFLSVKTVIWP